MKNKGITVRSVIFPMISLLFFACVFPSSLKSQDWKLKKQDEQVSIYVRQTDNANIKEYKGRTVIAAPQSEIYKHIVDFDRYAEWMDDLMDIKILESTRDDQYIYYLAYNVPWPFSDRDMVARANVIRDTTDNRVHVESVPVEDMVEKKDKMVRIEDFWQNWTLIPQADHTTEVILEGYNDPGGNIPSWLVNWGVVDTPFNILKNLKKRCEN